MKGNKRKIYQKLGVRRYTRLPTLSAVTVYLSKLEMSIPRVFVSTRLASYTLSTDVVDCPYSDHAAVCLTITLLLLLVLFCGVSTPAC